RRDEMMERLKSAQSVAKTKLDRKRADLEKLCQEYNIDNPETARMEASLARRDYNFTKTQLGIKERELATQQTRLANLDKEPINPHLFDRYFQQSPLLQDHHKSLSEINKKISDVRRVYLPAEAAPIIKELTRERETLNQLFEQACRDLRPEAE